MFGTIVLWKPDRGFGFIRQAGRPEDIFFNVAEFAGDQMLLAKGALVEFDLGSWKSKIVARDVRILTSEEADVTASVAAEAQAVRAVLGSGAE
jgi:cold shock CspA family protein